MVPRKKRKVPKVSIGFKIKPHILEMVRLGANYHGIKYQLYLQWLIEEGIKREAQYYGWSVLSTPYKIQGPTEAQRIKILRLMQLAKRKVSPTH